MSPESGTGFGTKTCAKWSESERSRHALGRFRFLSNLAKTVSHCLAHFCTQNGYALDYNLAARKYSRGALPSIRRNMVVKAGTLS